jgi:two-component system, NarL family, nitrate/nitrite response regulator NarL
VDRISVFVCEAQPIVIEGLQRVFSSSGDLELVGSVSRLNDAIEPLQRLQPRLFLIDQTGGTSSILRFVSTLKTAGSGSFPVLWANELAEADSLRALQLGIRGILKKTASPQELMECLREVAGGKIWMEDSSQIVGFLQRRETSRLTPRERDVVRLICQGMKNKQIAAKLGITPGTVKVHLMHIFEKTGLKDRFALAVHGRSLPGLEREVGQTEPLKLALEGVDQR